MIYVVPITLWEIFKTLCMGMAVAESNDIIYKASRKTFKFIQADFNEKICLADESSNEFKACKEKKQNWKMDRQGYPVTA